MPRFAVVALALAINACSWIPIVPPTPVQIPITQEPITWRDIAAMSRPSPGKRIAYGPQAQQFGILRLPSAHGPAPVAVLIHGGCWLNQFDLGYFEHWAQWLTDQGYATWNLEYRRLGDTGGGWPGTFTDIAHGIDHLRQLGDESPLDLDRLVVIGHSAGGQLALWSATRQTLPASSELFLPEPMTVHKVIGLAAITDLQQYRIGPANSCHASVDPLLGGSPREVPRRYALASPLQRLPLQTQIALISGSADAIVSATPVRAFVGAANAAGDQARYLELPGAGHFDTAVPTPASRAAMRMALFED